MRKWAIIKYVNAKTLMDAYKREKEAEIASIHAIVPESEILSPLIGTDVSVIPDDEDYEDKLGFQITK